MVPVAKPLDDLGSGLFSREIEEELLDVLDFERSLLERILLEEVFHGFITIPDSGFGRHR